MLTIRWWARTLLWSSFILLPVAASTSSKTEAVPLMRQLGFETYSLEKTELRLSPATERGVGEIQFKIDGRLLLSYEDSVNSREITLDIPVHVTMNKSGAVAKVKTAGRNEDSLRIWNAENIRFREIFGTYEGFEISNVPLAINLGETIVFKKTQSGSLLTASDWKSSKSAASIPKLTFGTSIAKVTMLVEPRADNRTLELIYSRDRQVSRVFQLEEPLLDSLL